VRPLRPLAGALLAALFFTLGCAATAPRLIHPYKVRSFCGTLQARMTGVDSIMTSTDDKILDERPTETDVLRAVQSGDGVIAYWHAQPLSLPNIAATLGETDGYVRVDAVAVAPTADQALTRRLYLFARDHGRDRWIALTAYDTQNVCVEGHRDV
jgi:hypothetical protein